MCLYNIREGFGHEILHEVQNRWWFQDEVLKLYKVPKP